VAHLEVSNPEHLQSKPAAAVWDSPEQGRLSLGAGCDRLSRGYLFGPAGGLSLWNTSRFFAV